MRRQGQGFIALGMRDLWKAWPVRAGEREKRMKKAVLVFLAAGGIAWGQNSAPGGAAAAGTADHASAYYHYALAHIYAEMAAEPGGREFIDRAVENYKASLKDDPSSGAVSEELADFYVQAGLLSNAEADAQTALKQNP